jgi:hypothetical protein
MPGPEAPKTGESFINPEDFIKCNKKTFEPKGVDFAPILFS